MGWREVVHVGELMSDRGSPCFMGTFLPFIRKTKVPLTDNKESMF